MTIGLKAGTWQRDQNTSFISELQTASPQIALGRIRWSVIKPWEVTGAALCSEDWMSWTLTFMAQFSLWGWLVNMCCFPVFSHACDTVRGMEISVCPLLWSRLQTLVCCRELFCTDIHVPLGMNRSDLVERMTFSFSATMRLIFLDFSKMTQQLLHRPPWRLVQVFMFPSGWTLITFIFSWPLLWRCHEVKSFIL